MPCHAALAIWCLIRRCTRRRRQRPGADIETGCAPYKPGQQQQFIVGGATLPPYRPPPQQQQHAQPAWQPQQPGRHDVPAAPGEAAGWAFAYKLAGGTRRAFATHAGLREACLKEWTSIDEWLHRTVAMQQQWQQCVLYSDQPPAGEASLEGRADASHAYWSGRLEGPA